MTQINSQSRHLNSNWVIANWKMNPVTLSEVHKLMTALVQKCELASQADLPNIAIAPSFVHLHDVAQFIEQAPIALSAQNVCGYNANQGAYTGEISAKQLTDMRVESVIIGHSERRQYFAEDNQTLTQKLDCALAQGLMAIFCVGETLEQYESQQTQQVIAEQLKPLIPFLTDQFVSKIIIAYEPVWAIGTGKVPTVHEVTQVHQFIAKRLANTNSDFAKTPILYGGSVKADNVKDFAQSPVISGVLVGGASLDADSFWQIVTAFSH